MGAYLYSTYTSKPVSTVSPKLPKTGYCSSKEEEEEEMVGIFVAALSHIFPRIVRRKTNMMSRARLLLFVLAPVVAIASGQPQPAAPAFPAKIGWDVSKSVLAAYAPASSSTTVFSPSRCVDVWYY